MDLAKPAPRVSGAKASMAAAAEAAVVDAAEPRRAPNAEPPSRVEPAEPLDDPSKHAPMHKVNEEFASNGTVLSVDALRGTTGADFEARAAVLRGADKNCLQKVLPCIFDERDFVSYGEVVRFVLVKGGNCFVYTEEKDVSPLYSIPLNKVWATVEDRNNPDPKSITISPETNTNVSQDDLVTVLLKYNATRKICYQFTFNKCDMGLDVADRFVATVNGVTGSVAKHGDKSSSLVYAEAIAKQTEKRQPEDPNQT